MSAAGIARALWPPMRRILIRIGRWVLDDLLEDGIRFVAYYLRKRANKVFARRLRRARARWRQRWLRRRILRWNSAATWLEQHAGSLSRRALTTFRELAARIPETAPGESMRRAA